MGLGLKSIWVKDEKVAERQKEARSREDEEMFEEYDMEFSIFSNEHLCWIEIDTQMVQFQRSKQTNTKPTSETFPSSFPITHEPNRKSIEGRRRFLVAAVSVQSSSLLSGTSFRLEILNQLQSESWKSEIYAEKPNPEKCLKHANHVEQPRVACYGIPIWIWKPKTWITGTWGREEKCCKNRRKLFFCLKFQSKSLYPEKTIPI